jgi:hypothetical protein
MSEQTPPDPLLTALREREVALLNELAEANQAVAAINGRISEVRDYPLDAAA